MRRFSYLLLLIPVFLLAGCDGVVVDLGQESQVTPEPESEPELQPDKAKLLVFTAKWCSACQRDKPRIEELRRQGVQVTVIDVDEQPELAKKYGITQLPTYIVLDENGDEVERTGSIIAVLSILSVILKIVLFFFG